MEENEVIALKFPLRLKKLKLSVTALSLLIILGACNTNNKLDDKAFQKSVDSLLNTGDTAVSKMHEPTAGKDLATNWSYDESEDKMTSKIISYASVTAKDELYFDFPYDGGSTATLTLRKKNKSTDIYLQVSKGQFNSSYDGGAVRIRFDQQVPRTYSFSGASDYSSDIIFIDLTKDFITKLKSSNRLLIEAEFYSAGKHQMEFDVSGLIWDK